MSLEHDERKSTNGKHWPQQRKHQRTHDIDELPSSLDDQAWHRIRRIAEAAHFEHGSERRNEESVPRHPRLYRDGGVKVINCRKIQNFQKDRAIEKKVADFVDENFYSQLSAIPKYSNFCRTAELSAQYQGIDLSVGQSLIDEKVKNTSCPNEIGNYWASVEIY